MSGLTGLLADYLALRRSLGYKLQRASQLLTQFVAYAERTGAEYISVELALAWAVQTANPDSGWRAQRLGVVRCFARYAQAIDPDNQVPPAGMIPRGRRPAPYLYWPAEIAALMAAARGLSGRLRSATLEALVGLLAVTGLRVGEVIRLDRDDIDLDNGLLVVRQSKLGKSRIVPLHSSTVEALRAYAARRDQLCPRPDSASFFVSTAGTRLRAGNLRAGFVELLGRAGLPNPARPGRARIGDLRHSFAVTTLLDWHTQAVDVAALLPLLSTFMGHSSPASTYWYLSAAPELLAAVAQRLEPGSGAPA